ncbi:MAG: AgmX/PglI C-terminal domain-containing protein [Desulfatiglans sp.]|nr:AgmX/PglI C-terminal domain-containing protein [Desulfatiglans sp.]
MENIHADNKELKPDNGTAKVGNIAVSNCENPTAGSIKIEVYKRNEFIGKKVFSQGRIVIGKSLEADLVLTDETVADQHACITVIDKQIVILDQTQKGSLLINGALCGISIINLTEQVGLGPYSLTIIRQKEVIDDKSSNLVSENEKLKQIKAANGNEDTSFSSATGIFIAEQAKRNIDQIKKVETPEVDLFSLLEGSQEPENTLFDLVFEGDIKTGFAVQDVKSSLSKILKVEESRIEPFFKGNRVILKSSLEIETAKKYKSFVEKSGAICRLYASRISITHDPVQLKTAEKKDAVISKPTLIKKETESTAYTKKNEPAEPARQFIKKREEKAVWKFYGAETDDESDEDDIDLPADFLLKDKINDLNRSCESLNTSNGKYLEILKLNGNEIIDIRHLNENERFFITDDMNKRFCLAEYTGAEDARFYFREDLQGYLETEDRPPFSLEEFIKDENCTNRRKRIFGKTIPLKARAVVSDGFFEYQMRLVSRSLIPEAPDVARARKKPYKHLGVSLVFHIVFLTFLGFIPSFHSENKPDDGPRFVKLDSAQIAELEKVINPLPQHEPKPEPKSPAQPPVKEPIVKKKPEPVITKKEPVKLAADSKPSAENTASGPDKHPDAGGGSGKGNVSARNINQTGILSMISDSVGIQPRSALAAVTNLDAVSTPNVSVDNFKVGGVVGKLGTGEISVPKASSAIVSTKGSSQVLRSHGASGEGRVAALQKGTTGEKEVMGMVTVTPDKSVRISGGLSMEAVKRVIDQHLDDITYCYETELINNPSIMGKVMFEWKIMLSGEVGEVRIKSSSINSHEIHNCIKESIRGWQFPKPSGAEVIVSYPFVFDVVAF